jgi:hypothetical protein
LQRGQDDVERGTVDKGHGGGHDNRSHYPSACGTAEWYCCHELKVGKEMGAGDSRGDDG